MPTVTDEITFDDWLGMTEEKRAELLKFSISEMPKDAGERHTEIEKAIQLASDAGAMLADAEGFLTHATAKEVFSVRKEHDDLTADERKAIVRDRVRDIQRLCDGLSVTHRAIQSRIYAVQNANRARL